MTYDPLVAILLLGFCGLLIVPMGILVSQLEKRAARRRGQPWPSDHTPADRTPAE